ncbi:S9 family peptidase [Candidatus Zixiibacteriota bacterium]
MHNSRNIILTILIGFLILSPFNIFCSDSNIKTDSDASLLNQGEYIPDIATFLQISKNYPAGVSWDGENVFFKSKMSGADQIYRITDKGWPYQLTMFDDGIDFFRLSNKGNLAIVGASVGGSEQSQLYLMDTKTGQIIQISDFDDVMMGSVFWSKDDKTIYYRSNQENKRDFFVYQTNISTKETKKIFDYAGYNYISNLSQDGKWMIISDFNSNADNDLFLLNTSSGEYKKLNIDTTNVRYSAIYIMPDNQTLWMTCNDNKDGIRRLATMEIATGKVKIIDDGWVDPKWEVEDIVFSKDYKLMAVTINENGYFRLKIREVDTKKELPYPPLDGQLEISDFDMNSNIVLAFNGPTRANNVWKWNPYTEELKQLTFSTFAGIDRTIFQPPTLITYKSFDGLEIPAFLYLPAGFKEGEPIPFIVSAHGGPASQFKPQFIVSFQYLLLNGFGILAPNPRGSRGYGLEYMNMDNYKNRKHSLMDYKAGADWLIENKYALENKLGIQGGSYGGYVVLGMITEYPDLFVAAIDRVGIANFQTYLQNTKSYRRAHREAEYGPLTDPDFLYSISPINKAHLIKTPLLVIHGVNDPRIPIDEARQMIGAIQNNNGVVDSLIFHDEGHSASKLDNTIRSYLKQVEFYNKYLK